MAAEGLARVFFLIRPDPLPWYLYDADAGWMMRPGFEGTVFEKYDFKLMLDFGSGLTAGAGNVGFVQDAYMNARFLPQLIRSPRRQHDQHRRGSHRLRRRCRILLDDHVRIRSAGAER